MFLNCLIILLTFFFLGVVFFQLVLGIVSFFQTNILGIWGLIFQLWVASVANPRKMHVKAGCGREDLRREVGGAVEQLLHKGHLQVKRYI